MKHEPFIYLWYIAWTKMFYLGVTNGKKEYYTHSAYTSEEFRDIVPHSTRSLSERKEFMNNLPKGVRYRKLSKRLIDHFMKEFDIEGDTIYEKMCKLEHKLLVNRKNRHWDRYYNDSLGHPRYVDVSGENHHFFGKKRPEHSKRVSGKMNPMFGEKHTEETRKKMSESTSGENNPNFKHGNTVGCSSPDKEVRKRAIKKRDAISYANNKDRILARNKEHYAKNKDEINAKARAKRQREKQERQGVGTLVPHM